MLENLRWALFSRTSTLNNMYDSSDKSEWGWFGTWMILSRSESREVSRRGVKFANSKVVFMFVKQ